MGAGASLQEDVPTGWHALAAMAEAADKPDLVAKIVRENQIDAATALKLDDDDLRELVDRKLDFKKLQGARDELRELQVDAVNLAEIFALRSFADPNVLVLYGVLVAGSSDVATVAERPDAAAARRFTSGSA